MNDNELVPSPSLKINRRFFVCYVGIALALSMSAFSLASLYGYIGLDHKIVLGGNKVVDKVSAETTETKAPIQDNKSISQVSSDEKLKTIQALNLLYSAEFSFNILHNKSQTIQIITLVETLIPSSLVNDLHILSDKIDKYVVFDKSKIISTLDDLKKFYFQQVQKGKFGQKTIAQVVRVEDQEFMQKQNKFLDNIQVLQISIEADNLFGLEVKINNIINSANDIDQELGANAKMLSQFAIENDVSFDNLLTSLHQELGNK